ncbi:MAG: AMP-binding protein [Pseudomonadota bacterium]
MSMREWAQREPDRIAVVFGEQRTTYGELEASANRLANWFGSIGLQRGQHVAAILPNGPLVFVLVWAAYRSGLYITPVSNALSAQEAAYVVRNSEARVVLVDVAFASVGESLPALCADCGDVRWVATSAPIAGFEQMEVLLQDMPASPRAYEPPGNMMFYTSGTTGAPKGVYRPLLPEDYQGLPPFSADLVPLYQLDEHSHYLSPAPLYHAAPLRFGLSMLTVGGTVYVMEKFDAARALDLLQHEHITHSQWVPAMFQRMLKLPEERRAAFSAPHLRVAIHAAAPCPQPLKRQMIDWWGPVLLEYYSGSEGVGLTDLTSEEWLKKPGSVGRARKGIPHILGDTDEELGPNQVGRIYFSGTSRFEYFNEPEKTAARTSPQGWQTMGDVGYLDEDGYLFLTDRLDDMIISGGVNVYPQEIENTMMESPLVADCGVVGIDDEAFGERPMAFIVLNDPALNEAEAIEALQAFAESKLGRIKRPAGFRIMPVLPRSPTGKLLRRALREERR